MKTKVCFKCGADILESQAFCTKCGAPIESKPICIECGTELKDGQEFCTKCGRKLNLKQYNDISTTIDHLNFNPGKRKKKSSKQIAFCFTVSIILIAIATVVYFVMSGSFNGKYVKVSDEPNIYYEFEDNNYIYKTNDNTEKGTYKVERDKVTITDSDRNYLLFFRSDEYIFSSVAHYNESLKDGDTVSQTLTKSLSTEDNTLELNYELKLNIDGTYKYTYEMRLNEITYDGSDEYGTYDRNGNLLILSPKDASYTKTYIIKDNLVYTSVYLKE